MPGSHIYFFDRDPTHIFDLPARKLATFTKKADGINSIFKTFCLNQIPSITSYACQKNFISPTCGAFIMFRWNLMVVNPVNFQFSTAIQTIVLPESWENFEKHDLFPYFIEQISIDPTLKEATLKKPSGQWHRLLDEYRQIHALPLAKVQYTIIVETLNSLKVSNYLDKSCPNIFAPTHGKKGYLCLLPHPFLIQLLLNIYHGLYQEKYGISFPRFHAVYYHEKPSEEILLDSLIQSEQPIHLENNLLGDEPDVSPTGYYCSLLYNFSVLATHLKNPLALDYGHILKKIGGPFYKLIEEDLKTRLKISIKASVDEHYIMKGILQWKKRFITNDLFVDLPNIDSSPNKLHRLISEFLTKFKLTFEKSELDFLPEYNSLPDFENYSAEAEETNIDEDPDNSIITEDDKREAQSAWMDYEEEIEVQLFTLILGYFINAYLSDEKELVNFLNFQLSNSPHARAFIKIYYKAASIVFSENKENDSDSEAYSDIDDETHSSSFKLSLEKNECIQLSGKLMRALKELAKINPALFPEEVLEAMQSTSKKISLSCT